MTAWIGCVLLLSVIAGGVYFYYKVERLDREIDSQCEGAVTEEDDEKS